MVVLAVAIVCAVYLYSRAQSYLDVGIFISSVYLYFAVRNTAAIEKLKIVFCVSCVSGCVINLIIIILQIVRHDNPIGLFSNEIALLVLFLGGIVSSIELYKKFNNKFLRVALLLLILVIVGYAIYIKSRTIFFAIALMATVLYKKRWLMIVGISLFVIICLSIFYKLDSTYGRITILNIALSIPDNAWEIIFGVGENGFAERYMLKQSEILANLDCETQYLADNINHPLNDFIYMYIRYGLGFCVLAILLIKGACKNHIIGKFNTAILAMLFAFACVSYPFRYPISWIFLAFALGCNEFGIHNEKRIPALPIGAVIFVLATIPLCLSYGVWKNERLLYDAVGRSMLGKNESALSYYNKIDDKFCGEKVIVGHARAELGAGNYRAALDCMEKLSLCDYETSLLKGEIFNALLDYPRAIQCFELASKMCPSRFIPLYEIYNAACKSNDIELRERVRTQIINKDIKVPSSKI